MGSMGCYIDGEGDECALDTGDVEACDVAGDLVGRGLCKVDCPYWRHTLAVTWSEQGDEERTRTKFEIMKDAAKMRAILAENELEVYQSDCIKPLKIVGQFGVVTFVRGE